MQPVKLMPVQIPVYRGCVWDLLPATQVVPKPQVQVSAVSLKPGKIRKAQELLCGGRGKQGAVFSSFYFGCKMRKQNFLSQLISLLLLFRFTTLSGCLVNVPEIVLSGIAFRSQYCYKPIGKTRGE